MVDTLQLSVPEYDIAPDHGLTIQPASFRPRTGELIGDFRLWDGQEGRAAYYNGDRFNVDLKPYQGQVYLTVHMSLPGYIGENNVAPVTREDASRIVANLQREVSALGVRCNLQNAHVSRLDAFRNIQTCEPFHVYAPILSLLDGKRMRDMVQYGGSSFRWGNSLAQVNAYDKVLQLASKKHSVEQFRGVNLVRFEHRSLKRRKVEDLYGFVTVSDLLREYDSIPGIYSRTMGDVLFRYGGEDVEVLSQRQLEQELREFKQRAGRYWMSEYLLAVGMKALLSRVSVQTVTEAVRNVSGNRMAATRNKRRLQRALVNQTLLTERDEATRSFRKLYDELRTGVLLAA